MTITSIVYAWSLLHLRLLDIVPLARSEIFAFIEDAIVVVDLDNCIADVNLAGQQLAPAPNRRWSANRWQPCWARRRSW